VILKQYDAEQTPALVARLRQAFSQWPEAEINVKEFTQGPVTDQPVTVRLFSNSLTDLERYAGQLAQYLRQTPGFVNINNPIGEPQTELKLVIDYPKAALQGINIQQLDTTLQTLLSGTIIGQFNDSNGEYYPIEVKQNQHTLTALKQLEITNQQGQKIPLSSFVTPQLVKGQADFFHYQKLRMAKVSADVATGYSVNQLTQQVQQFLQQQQLPNSIRFELGGEEENRQKSFGGLTQIMIITAIGIMAILVFQFNSFLQPLIIFSSIPFAIAGSAIGLYLFDLSFSMMAFIGLISLFGIVVNDAILLVDTANQNIQAGLTKFDAIIAAAHTRFTPIILTTLTTIGGLIPLTVWGGNLWQPLGVVIISGMVVAGITSLLIVPLLTFMMTRAK
jgi:multidrug efflux pump subunit AcrB